MPIYYLAHPIWVAPPEDSPRLATMYLVTEPISVTVSPCAIRVFSASDAPALRAVSFKLKSALGQCSRLVTGRGLSSACIGHADDTTL